MKHWTTVVACLGIILLCAASEAPAAGANWEQLLQKLYPAAKKEGEVIFNTERIEEVGGKEGLAQFQKRFPGIKVTMTGVAGTVLPSRIMAEARAGKVSVDAFRSDPMRAHLLIEKDLAVTINPNEWTDQPLTLLFDNRFVKVTDHISNFACNTDMVAKADRPKKYEDLLNPKFKGKLILDARGGQFRHLLAHKLWDKDRFWNFMKALKAQDPIWASRNTEAMAKLTAGEGWISTGSYAAIQKLKEKGAPVEFLFISPAFAQMRGVTIVKGSPHPNATKLFVGWLVSPEAQAAMDKGHVGTVTPGTMLYKEIQEGGYTLSYDDEMEKLIAGDKIEDEIAKEWGVVK